MFWYYFKYHLLTRPISTANYCQTTLKIKITYCFASHYFLFKLGYSSKSNVTFPSSELRTNTIREILYNYTLTQETSHYIIKYTCLLHQNYLNNHPITTCLLSLNPLLHKHMWANTKYYLLSPNESYKFLQTRTNIIQQLETTVHLFLC